ncbi:SOS response-associated peptidase [Taibaiella lutea]|uniref:Abasic site processing protein n=1 Tax=Taibaiella lutea TaxID=2608001 RepID=A0A5M6CHK8_9BACT|nr:SOS response-associated peptidase family protein [Taibaiella lutea]KAA5532629.1 SOS response-associated peptidase [Taibaiella lutea]
MCYHVSTPKKAKLEAKAREENLVIQGEFEQYYHVSGFARPYLPVTINTEPTVIQPAQWKLIPHWVANEEGAKKYSNTLNAESTGIFDKASYKPYIQKFRGLLWIDGFYEPHKVEGKKETENYYLYRPNNEIFTLGIVYSPWINKDTGELTHTIAVITTHANELLAEIHNEKKRMPLVISESDREGWLHAKTRPEIESFMQPAGNDYLLGHKITARVTSGKQDFNIPEVQEKAPEENKDRGLLF